MNYSHLAPHALIFKRRCCGKRCSFFSRRRSRRFSSDHSPRNNLARSCCCSLSPSSTDRWAEAEGGEEGTGPPCPQCAPERAAPCKERIPHIAASSRATLGFVLRILSLVLVGGEDVPREDNSYRPAGRVGRASAASRTALNQDGSQPRHAARGRSKAPEHLETIQVHLLGKPGAKSWPLGAQQGRGSGCANTSLKGSLWSPSQLEGTPPGPCPHAQQAVLLQHHSTTPPNPIYWGGRALHQGAGVVAGTFLNEHEPRRGQVAAPMSPMPPALRAPGGILPPGVLPAPQGKQHLCGTSKPSGFNGNMLLVSLLVKPP